MNHHEKTRTPLTLLAIACAATTISACSGSRSAAGLFPPDPPTETDVVAEQKKVDDAWNLIPGENDPEKAVYFVNAGMKKSEEACTTFFAATAKLQSETTFAKDTLTTAVSAAGVIASLATASTSVLTGLFGASGLFPKVIDDFNQIFLFASVSDELSGQIKSAMEDHYKQNPVNGANFCSGKSDCQRKATKLVRDHAYFCTISNLKHVVKTSVASSCVTATPSDATKPAAASGSNCPGGTPSTPPQQGGQQKPPAGGAQPKILMRSGPVMMLAPAQ